MGGGSAPGASDCFYLGKVLEFTNGGTSTTSYVVTGTTPVIAPPSGTVDADIVRFYIPQKTVTDQEEFNIPWDLETQSMRLSGAGDANSLAFLRSPESGQVIAYVFRNLLNTGPVTGPLPVLTGSTNSINANTAYRQGFICIQSPFITGQRGVVAIAGGQGQDLIKTATDLTGASALTGVPGIVC